MLLHHTGTVFRVGFFSRLCSHEVSITDTWEMKMRPVEVCLPVEVDAQLSLTQAHHTVIVTPKAQWVNQVCSVLMS